MSFSTIAKELREETGLSQQKLGELLGLSSSGIGHLEVGDNEPKGSTLIAYSKFFDVSADYLLGLEDETGARVLSAPLPTTAAMGDGITKKEKALLEAFSKLLPETQDFVLRSIQSMSNKKTVT